MSTVWVAILALVAGSAGTSCPVNRDDGRLTVDSVARGTDPGPSCSLSIGRSVGHRHRSVPWSAGGMDEFDSEESDETWIVHLDLLASVPVSWLPRVSPDSQIDPIRFDDVDSPFPASYPLRC